MVEQRLARNLTNQAFELQARAAQLLSHKRGNAGMSPRVDGSNRIVESRSLPLRRDERRLADRSELTDPSSKLAFEEIDPVARSGG